MFLRCPTIFSSDGDYACGVCLRTMFTSHLLCICMCMWAIGAHCWDVVSAQLLPLLSHRHMLMERWSHRKHSTYDTPRALYFTGCAMSKVCLVAVVETRQSTHWSSECKLQIALSTKGNVEGGVVCWVRILWILWDVVMREAIYKHVLGNFSLMWRPGQWLRSLTSFTLENWPRYDCCYTLYRESIKLDC